MSDDDPRFDPAIGLLEFDSIAAGIVAGDAMAKAAPIASLHAGTVHPGRYLVLVGGDTASVEVALDAGGADTLVDSLFLADVHPAVVAAITDPGSRVGVDGEALGVIEASASATTIVAADAGVKAADVTLLAIRLADDLGGKAYCLFSGVVAEVEAAVEAAIAHIEPGNQMVGSTVIPRLHAEMIENLAAELRFNVHLRDGGS